jgi:hypothetical protein
METKSKPRSERSTNESDELNYFGLDCTNPSVNAYYVGIHAISERTYEEMVARKFPGTIPDEHEEAADFVVATNYDCSWHVQFDTGTLADSNEDITFTIVPPAIGKYSMHFFRGIQSFFSVGAYRFSKAKDANDQETLVIRVLDNDNNTVYRGDLTNMFP